MPNLASYSEPCLLEFAYLVDNERFDKVIYCESEHIARVSLEHFEKNTPVIMVYARIRKLKVYKDICIHYTDKGDFDNEIYINHP